MVGAIVGIICVIFSGHIQFGSQTSVEIFESGWFGWWRRDPDGRAAARSIEHDAFFPLQHADRCDLTQ